jgi:aspartate aminotransferase
VQSQLASSRPFPVDHFPLPFDISYRQPVMPTISDRVRALKPSVTISFMNRAKAMKAKGMDVLSFAAGEPDFDTPQPIKDAAIKALLAGQTKYMPTLGDEETRAAIASKFTNENGIQGLGPEHISIGSGGKHSLYVLCQVIFDQRGPGETPDECVLPVPAWVSYAPLVEIAGGRIVEVPTTVQNGFKATAAQVREAITPRTKLVILNSPSNPCGTMYSPEELQEIGKVIAEAARTVAPDIMVLSDELYEKIIFGGIPHFSIGSMPEIAERTITLNGLSKAYGMTGWRIGYTCIPGAYGKTFTSGIATLQGQMTTNITSFVYPAIRTALRECAPQVEEMRQAFARRATVINERLSGIPGVSSSPATGAFYSFPNVSFFYGRTTKGGRLLRGSLDFCEALLEENLVAFVPGDDFGGCGREHVRISFACSEDQIHRGLDRLQQFLTDLRD